MSPTKIKAYKEIVKNIKSQIKLLQDEGNNETISSQIDIRKELLKYFENCQQGYSYEIRENPILNNLRMKGQNLRQKYRDGLLH